MKVMCALFNTFFLIEKYPRKIKCLEISEEGRHGDHEASGESCQMSSYRLKLRKTCLGNVIVYLAHCSYIHSWNLIKLLSSES